MIPLLRSRVSSRSSVLYGLRLRVQADFFKRCCDEQKVVVSFSACVLESLDRPRVGYTTREYREYRRSRGPTRGRVGDGGHKGIRRMRRKKLPNGGYIRFPVLA